MSTQIVTELSRVIAPGIETISAMGSQQTNFYDAHFKKNCGRSEFCGLAQIVDPQGVNFDDVGILGARQNFVRVQSIEFLTIVAGKGIYIIIAMRNLTQEFHDKIIPVEAVIFISSEIHLVATIVVIIRETRCRPCCVGK